MSVDLPGQLPSFLSRVRFLIVSGSAPFAGTLATDCSGQRCETWRECRSADWDFCGLGFLMTRLTGFPKPVEDSKASLRDMRSVAVGALGEALVRAELEVLSWPMLCNVILGASGRSVEIDQLARAPGGVIVLETKTSSGHVDGDLRSECWILSLARLRGFAPLKSDFQPGASR